MADERIAQMEGPAALPRKNGELVFEAPWEGRAFGLAVALSDRRVYDWDEFRAQLISEIGSGEAPYYESWLAALERVLLSHGLVTASELDQRTDEYASGERTDEDDHDHDHEHDE